MILRSLLPRIFIRSETGVRMRSFIANHIQFTLPQIELETNIFKKAITRRIFTCYQLSEMKGDQSLNFCKADETYFDFKECSAKTRGKTLKQLKAT